MAPAFTFAHKRKRPWSTRLDGSRSIERSHLDVERSDDFLADVEEHADPQHHLVAVARDVAPVGAVQVDVGVELVVARPLGALVQRRQRRLRRRLFGALHTQDPVHASYITVLLGFTGFQCCRIEFDLWNGSYSRPKLT